MSQGVFATIANTMIGVPQCDVINKVANELPAEFTASFLQYSSS